ncbi:MAG: late competence development ComFB family protein [Candidatus Paceibacterota bacterium]|jgi:competence protein ComFB
MNAKIREKLHNYMEDLAEDVLEEIYSKHKEYCQCDKCRLDVLSRILNRVPPKYVVTLKGGAFTKLQGLELQFRADITREAVKALDLVALTPRH